MSSAFELDEEKLGNFERTLFATESTRVESKALWRALAVVFPHRTPGPAERSLLLSSLRALEARGRVRLPTAKGKRWDRSIDPPVPKSIDLIRDDVPAAPAVWRTFPWHPTLQWVAQCRTLSARQVAFLQRVHIGLVNEGFSETAPLKYRSLQLTGHEKLLEALATTSLFGEGRLSLGMLACFPDVLPLAWESVGLGGRMVVFENAGPFAVARRVLRELGDRRPYDLVAYGGGRSVVASIGHLASIDQAVESIRYVGDMDGAGLDIAWNAARSAASFGLPAVLPATELHRQMLASATAFGSPHGWPALDVPAVDFPRVLSFLDPEIRVAAGGILEAKRRVPEEILGPEELRHAWKKGR